MYERVGRKIYRSNSGKPVKQRFVSRVMNLYYNSRIKRIEKRISKYAGFSRGYQYELFRAAVYHKQSYMHKKQALVSKDELRAYERRLRDE